MRVQSPIIDDPTRVIGTILFEFTGGNDPMIIRHLIGDHSTVEIGCSVGYERGVSESPICVTLFMIDDPTIVITSVRDERGVTNCPMCVIRLIIDHPTGVCCCVGYERGVEDGPAMVPFTVEDHPTRP
jgi:hypothetical protein